MICLICRQKGIRVVNPCWLKEKSIEVCMTCAKKLKLKGIEVKYKSVDGVRMPCWNVHTPAKRE